VTRDQCVLGVCVTGCRLLTKAGSLEQAKTKVEEHPRIHACFVITRCVCTYVGPAFSLSTTRNSTLCCYTGAAECVRGIRTQLSLMILDSKSFWLLSAVCAAAATAVCTTCCRRCGMFLGVNYVT
jgi:hypothetical protein